MVTSLVVHRNVADNLDVSVWTSWCEQHRMRSCQLCPVLHCYFSLNSKHISLNLGYVPRQCLVTGVIWELVYLYDINPFFTVYQSNKRLSCEFLNFTMSTDIITVIYYSYTVETVSKTWFHWTYWDKRWLIKKAIMRWRERWRGGGDPPVPAPATSKTPVELSISPPTMERKIKGSLAKEWFSLRHQPGMN